MGKELNKETNFRIRKFVKKYNRRNNCQKDLQEKSDSKFYRGLKGVLDSNPVGELEDFATDDDKIVKIEAPKENIYSGSGFASGFVRSIAGLEPSIRVNGHVFGVDKLGHFMAQGFEYLEELEAKSSDPFN